MTAPLSISDELSRAIEVSLGQLSSSDELDVELLIPSPRARAVPAAPVSTRAAIERVKPRVRWDVLELPAPTRAALSELLDSARAASIGAASAIFRGAAGSGRDAAAEVLALELDCELVRVDLAALGQAPAQLEALFRTERAALVFRNADRLGLAERNGLLFAMARYRGLAILCASASSLETGLVHGLRHRVDFPLPTAKERGNLWRRALSPPIDTCDVDWERLAQLRLSAGTIRRAAAEVELVPTRRGVRATMRAALDAVAQLHLRERGLRPHHPRS